ncbi:MAG: hypothetical protein K2I93_02050 [Oscillospiraceae bacterium]|nr:hypothetical protein [Oscillospiraceae bacterium]
MQENISELAQKYRDEMLRMYGTRKPSAPEPPAVSEPEQPLYIPADAPADIPADIPQTAETVDDTVRTAEDTVPTEADVTDNITNNITDTTDITDNTDTADEPPPLPSYIQSVPPMPTQWAAQEAYENFNTAEGKLRVVAAVANSAYPVPGAQVTVCTHIGGRCYLNYILVTDENGETPTVPLAAPPASLSQLPETNIPYAVYDIHIFANGFFRSEALGVHIFDNITTRQEFQMIPLPIYPDIHAANVNPNAEGRTEEVD